MEMSKGVRTTLGDKRVEADKDYLDIGRLTNSERVWEEPYHLTKTRTTFIRFTFLSYWDAAKLQLFDGTIPYECVQTYSFTIQDLEHLIVKCQSMIHEMKVQQRND